MTKRILAVFLVIPAVTHEVFAVAPEKPNIVVLMSDDHRWDALGVAGNRAVATPSLDRFGSKGMYCRQATAFTPQCIPNRTCTLAGVCAHQHGWTSNQSVLAANDAPPTIKQEFVTEKLAAAGYRTGLVGKWRLPIDLWRKGVSDVRLWLPRGSGPNVDPKLADGPSQEVMARRGYRQALFADDAVRFLGGPQASEKPFFLWVGFTAPHVSMGPNPRRFVDAYARRRFVDLLPPGFTPSRPTLDFRLYYQAVSHLDEEVGQILAALKANNLRE